MPSAVWIIAIRGVGRATVFAGLRPARAPVTAVSAVYPVYPCAGVALIAVSRPGYQRDGLLGSWVCVRGGMV